MAQIKQEIIEEEERMEDEEEGDDDNLSEMETNEECPIEDQTQFDFSKKLVCVEYPGVIKSVNKMMETLGGIENVSDVLSANTARRLELRFRPDDIYAKPACADKYPTLGVLLKVKLKTKKKRTPVASASTSKAGATAIVERTETTIMDVNVLGVCDEIFKFENFADFQYLPVHKHENGEIENIYEELIPDGPVDLSWLEQPATTCFFLPHTFSRIDNVDGYKYSSSNKDVTTDRNIIGRNRRPRSGFAKLCSFQEPIPERPFKGVFNILKSKMISENCLNVLKKCFETRPIWSRHALIACSNISSDNLKFLLPIVAYYYTSGPWRVMWVRYGFDPRIDPSARVYQTLDFRSKISAARHRRQTFPVTKLTNTSKKKVVLLTNAVHQPQKLNSRSSVPKKMINYIFKPGMLPDSKQMFYQYCDLFVPEIQAMMARLPEVSSDSVCNEKTGWLPTGFDERCREILHEEVAKSAKLMKKQTKGGGDPSSDEDEEEWLDDSDDSDYE